MAKSNYTYYKNNDTGDLVKKHEISSDFILNIPIRYYDIKGNALGKDDKVNLEGFIEISEEEWNEHT